jgi:myo-inositol-1(or 4)-monophosphatase
VAAGGLIVEEAGGRVSTIAGEPFRSRAGSVLASNGLIHDAMLKVIIEFSQRAPKRTE